MDLELLCLMITEYMKGNGSMIRNKERVMKNIQTETYILGILSMEFKRDKVYILGLMENHMMVNGLEGLKMEKEFGKVSMVMFIWGNGKMAKLMVMEYIRL